MAEEPIVDTHVHLWDPQRHSHSWLEPVPKLNRPHRVRDYDAAAAGRTVEAMVFVEGGTDPGWHRAEAEWVANLAAEEPRIAAMVPQAPLDRGEAARPEIEALCAASPLVRGVRRNLQGARDLGFCLRDPFQQGLALLEERGLSFDLCVKAHQLEAVVGLVRSRPDLRFVLDHMGKPDVRAGALDPWREHVRALAGAGNVWCKVSGLITEADHERWTADELRPYLEHVFECFGDRGAMFGSDWPVITLAGTFGRWVEILDEATSAFSADERRRFFRDNAMRCYRIGTSG